MNISAIHLPATRHIERIEIMTAETEAGTRGVTGQRQNRRPLRSETWTPMRVAT
jgi:hypothetical protein